MSPVKRGFRSLAVLAIALLPTLGEAQFRRVVKASGAGETASAPVPVDPHELSSTGVQLESTPAERLQSLKLLRAAADKGISHRPNMRPFHFQASFTASGNLSYTGSGELSETWMSGQSWRVTESLGNYSFSRIGNSGHTADQTPVSMIPMRAQMLRNEILWATTVNDAGTRQIRTAAAQWNGKPVTCILLSGGSGTAQTQSRLWEESEYCIDNDSGLLQIHSPVPGTYAVLGYTKNLQFHGTPMPDRIAIYVNGNEAVDSSLSVADPSAANQSLLAVTPEMLANRESSVVLSDARVITISLPGTSGSVAEPVMLHAQLGPMGALLEAEVSATANPALNQKALDAIKKMPFGMLGSHAYVNVRFLPPDR
jgi:hypothetical protein